MTSGQLPDELEAARCFEMSQPTRSPFPGKKIIRKLIKQNIKNFNISCLKAEFGDVKTNEIIFLRNRIIRNLTSPNLEMSKQTKLNPIRNCFFSSWDISIFFTKNLYGFLINLYCMPQPLLFVFTPL